MPTRRRFIQYLGAAGATRPLAAVAGPHSARAAAFGFDGLPHGVDDTHHLPPGYDAQVLLSWGDPLTPDGSAFDPARLDAAAQRRRFGYNNDYVAFLPLPPAGADERGLLCVNHEYTNPTFMWPGLHRGNLTGAMDRARTHTEMAAIGASVVELERHGSRWRTVASPYARRIDATTACDISGPAAGHARLCTGADPEGRRVSGILNPCSGGKTPWGTVLIAEENFQLVFRGDGGDDRERANHERYGVGRSVAYSWWGAHERRFDLAYEAREANRFGWVVELDPRRPDLAPVKRTALGRFKHEAANCVLNRDGRVVVYSGDDETFEHLYRFVTRDRCSGEDPACHRGLLDHGELSVARFHDDGSLTWLPLVHGAGPLVGANGFNDQGDVVIEARRAATLLGATRLDRPEDVEPSPRDGSVFVMLTNNVLRRPGQRDAANPRAFNRYGHVLRLLPPGAPGDDVDHAATEFGWETFLLAGDPDNPRDQARYPGSCAPGGWFAAPDNCAFDPAGRLWIASDQGRSWPQTGFADGLWACGDRRPGTAAFRRFFQAPIGAEVCGPEFTPDGRTLFLAVQHPGVDGTGDSSFDRPATRWPDFRDDLPPRPSVLAIRRVDGGLVGS